VVDSPKSLTEGVIEQLRSAILKCHLAPGARLRITDLCTRYDVSLGAVREALSRLSAEGLVVAEPQRGFRVAPVSAADLADLTWVRIEIETLALRQAIAKGDITWESGLVAAQHQLRRTPKFEPGEGARMNEAWSVAHAQFHAALVASCDSPWLLRLRATLFDQSERYRRLSVPGEGTQRNVDAEHDAIVEAALARDAGQATQLLAEHLRLTSRLVQQAFGLDEVLPAELGVAASRRR
jgi:DNA-binding GntR family transcriptional regulator